MCYLSPPLKLKEKKQRNVSKIGMKLCKVMVSMVSSVYAFLYAVLLLQSFVVALYRNIQTGFGDKQWFNRQNLKMFTI